MKKVVVSGPGSWRIEDAKAVSPGSGQVRLAPMSAGICGGDIDLLDGSNAVAAYPLVLGHECVAVVQEVGPDTSFVSGDYVAVYPTTSCRQCEACKAGWANHCRDMRTMGLAHPNGCFTDTLTVDEAQCVPIPERIALRYGALIEPVAVGCHVAARAGEMTGLSALVIGVGMIGSAVGMVAKARGVEVLVGSDLYETREAVARELGFDDLTTRQGDDLLSWLLDTVGPVDLVFDTVGSDETGRVGLEVLKPGGRFLALASSKPGQIWGIPYAEFFLKELQIISSRNYRKAAFEEAVVLLEERQPPIERLITARYPLERFGEAVDDLLSHPSSHVKVILEPTGR